MRGRPRTMSLKAFDVNIDRARGFLNIFDADRGRGRPTRDENELLRGCLVFAVGALDAYLSDLVLEVIPAYPAKSPTLDQALKTIAREDPGLSLRIVLEADNAARQDVFRNALRRWLDGRTFQGTERVQNALGYLGCAITWKEFDQWTEVNTSRELQRITEDRHAIVHSGRRPPITRQHAGNAVDLVADIAEVIDTRVRDRLVAK